MRTRAASLLAALALAGCGTATVATTTTTTELPASSTPPACAELFASVDAFNAAIAHPAAHEQLQTAATHLVDSIGATVKNAAKRADADAALRRLVTAVTAQPQDTAAMQAASNDLLKALQDAALVCGALPTSP